MATVANGSLPMYKGQVNKSALVRRVFHRSGPGMQLDNRSVIEQVKSEYGVTVTPNIVDNVRSDLRKTDRRRTATATPPTPDVLPQATLPNRVAVIAPPMVQKTSAVELVKLARSAIEAAGSKEALKELIDVL